MNENKNSFGVGIVIFGAVALMAGFLSSWYLAEMYIVQPAVSQNTNPPQLDTPAETRDKIRKEHSLTLANRFFTKQILLRQTVTLDQAGLDGLQTLNNQEMLKDPLTAKPYVFNGNQLEMVVGEVIFDINSNCDDKIQGSDGDGLVVGASSSSIALAIKLESGGYSCESNL